MQVDSSFNLNDGYTSTWAFILFAIAVPCVLLSIMFNQNGAPLYKTLAVAGIGVVLVACTISFTVYQSRPSVIRDGDEAIDYIERHHSSCPRCNVEAAVLRLGFTRRRQYVEYKCMCKVHFVKLGKYMAKPIKVEPGIPGVCEPNREDTI